MKKTPRVIAAVDVENRDDALKLTDSLAGVVDYFKIGSRLFTAEGPGMIEQMRVKGASVFLDLKFHDIPATVAGSVRAASALGISMMTIHTSGGMAMMEAAARAAAEGAEAAGVARPLVVGVTVLTSMSQEDLSEMSFYEGNVEDLVLRRAAKAKESGLDGVVASVKEAEAIRAETGEDFIIVTPGIRPSGSAVGDQKRVATPRVAAEAGADFLVIGRPIYQAPSPRDAAAAILEELREV